MPSTENGESTLDRILQPAKISLRAGVWIGEAAFLGINKILPIERVVQETKRLAYKPAEMLRRSAASVLDIGELTLRAYGKQPLGEKLRSQEPRSRARVALQGAQKALDKPEPDVTLGIFETLRASRAIGEVSKGDPGMALKVAPDIVEVVASLPDTETGANVAEFAISEALESPVSVLNYGSIRPVINLQEHVAVGRPTTITLQ